MHPTRNDLPQDTRVAIVRLLNERLADAIDLQLQTKQAHWNVRGPHFISLHELFDKVAETVEGYTDQIAERAAGLRAIAEGTVQVAAEHSFLVPYPLRIADEKQHLFAIASRLAAFDQSARDAIGKAAGFEDTDTADLFTEVSRGVDHQLWFVEAHAAPK